MILKVHFTLFGDDKQAANVNFCFIQGTEICVKAKLKRVVFVAIVKCEHMNKAY